MAFSGIVLAGGRSRRMGRDKRAVLMQGTPLLTAALDLLAAVSDDLIVACRREDAPAALVEGRAVRLAFDALGAGPIAGIEAGLRLARHRVAVVIPTDMPRLTPGMLIALVDALAAFDVEAAAFATPAGLTQFPLAIQASAIAVIQGRLAAGEFKVRSLLAALHVEPVDASAVLAGDPDAFMNVNTPADLGPRAATSQPRSLERAEDGGDDGVNGDHTG